MPFYAGHSGSARRLAGSSTYLLHSRLKRVHDLDTLRFHAATMSDAANILPDVCERVRLQRDQLRPARNGPGQRPFDIFKADGADPALCLSDYMRRLKSIQHIFKDPVDGERIGDLTLYTRVDLGAAAFYRKTGSGADRKNLDARGEVAFMRTADLEGC